MSATATSDSRATPRHANGRPGLALAITGAALFMVVLDNLVVTTALPSIRSDLGASVEQLGWFVNAYTLTFAVLLLPGRRTRRPLRPAADLPARTRALHARVGRRGARARAPASSWPLGRCRAPALPSCCR